MVKQVQFVTSLLYYSLLAIKQPVFWWMPEIARYLDKSKRTFFEKERYDQSSAINSLFAPFLLIF